MSQINENNHLSTDVLRDFAKQKIDEESSKDIKNDLIRELHGYPNEYGNDRQALKDTMKGFGVKIKNLSALKSLRGKIMGSTFVGLTVGPYIDVGTDDDLQTLVTHEAHHKLQFDENAPLPVRLPNDIRAIVGFLFISINTLKEINKLKASRKVYGSREAGRYAATHSGIEFEALLHEGDIQHLRERKPFEYKKYSNKNQQQKKLQELIDNDIQKAEDMKDQIFDMITSGKITDEDIKKLNVISAYLIEEAQKIQKIKEEYGQEEWDIIDVKHPIYGWSLRLESEKNRDKRLDILKKSLEKEDDLLRVLQRHKEVKVISTDWEKQATGVIKIKPKKLYRKDMLTKAKEEGKLFNIPTNILNDINEMNDKDSEQCEMEYRTCGYLLDELKDDSWIQEFEPHMYVDRLERDIKGNPIIKKGLGIKISVIA